MDGSLIETDSVPKKLGNGQSIQLISTKDCKVTEENEWFLAKKVLNGVLLWMKHFTSSKAISSQFEEKKGIYGIKQDMSSEYTRASVLGLYYPMFMFGDLMNPPQCFLIFTKTAWETWQLLWYAQSYITIGKMFCIAKPNPCSWTWHGMPIISTQESFLPLKFHVSFMSVTNMAPNLHLTKPRDKEQTYFYDP